MTQSSAELELEAEAVRAKVADTAESIRKKLTAGQLIDEFSDMVTGGDLASGLGNLKNQVRDNPLPIVLVGAGLAWLAFGKGITGQHSSHGSSSLTSGMSSTSRSYPAGMPPSPGLSHFAGPQGTASSHTSTRDGAHGGGNGSSMVSDVVEGAKEMAEGAAEAVSSASRSATNAVSGAADSLGATADRLRHSMLTGSSYLQHRVGNSASNIVEQEPLVVAALGVLLGAAVGAMLPSTELEQEQLGPQADRLRQGAKEMVDRGLESAGTVATKAYDALKEEADRQGIVPGGDKTLGEKVGEVVHAAASSAEEAARREIGANDAGSGRA